MAERSAAGPRQLSRLEKLLLRPPRLLLAAGSGLLLAFAFPPFNVPLVAWLSVAGLLIAVLGARPRAGLLGGLLSGVVFYLSTLPWIYTVMRVHGGVAPAAAAGVLALMIGTLSLFTAAFGFGVAFLAQKSFARACAAAPCLWVALEFGRTHMPLIGFPWNLLGYAAATNPVLLQLVPLTGIYGLSFLIGGYGALLAWARALIIQEGDPRGLHFLLAATAGLFAVALAGHPFLPEEKPRYVAHLVQTNFPQAPSYPADWLERHARELDELERISIAAAQKQPGLVVWPEVPAPFYLHDARFAARAERIAVASRSHFLVGVVDWRLAPEASPGPGSTGRLLPYNSAALLDPAGRRVLQYDKIHLVAFGEYVPLRRWLGFAEKLVAQLGDFQPGTAFTVGELPASAEPGRASGKFGVFICFEAIFPAQVRRFTAAGAELFINLSNDGWFGRSAAPEQHLGMARVRAVENRRWMLRATNNGHTVSVDPYGRIVARLPTDTRGVLAAPYDFRSERTLYARWGDWFAWLCVVATVGFLARARESKEGRKSESR